MSDSLPNIARITSRTYYFAYNIALEHLENIINVWEIHLAHLLLHTNGGAISIIKYVYHFIKVQPNNVKINKSDLYVLQVTQYETHLRHIIIIQFVVTQSHVNIECQVVSEGVVNHQSSRENTSSHRLKLLTFNFNTYNLYQNTLDI